MRRSMLALALAAVALGAAACSTSSAPGWTYAPPTAAPTPGESGAAAPSDGGSAAPSASVAPSAGESGAPSGSAGGETVQISAVNIAFEQPAVTAPADTAFTIDFDNKEAVPHNVEIKDAGGASVFKGEIVTGPTVAQYEVGPLAAGEYTFVCSVHPNMTGTLTAAS